MNTTTVAVDLAKSVFQLAVDDGKWRVLEQRRLTRNRFERRFINRDVWPNSQSVSESTRSRQLQRQR